MSKKKRTVNRLKGADRNIELKRGLNSNKISESLGIHPSTVRPILKNFFQKGSVEHDPRSGKSRMAEVGGDRFDQEEKFSKL